MNLTPHSIDVYTNGKRVISIPPSGIVLRVPVVKREISKIRGTPVYEIKYRLPELPEPQSNTIYIVSSIVLQILRMHGIKRDDFVSPDTSDPVRDEQGRIVGIKGFIVIGDE